VERSACWRRRTGPRTVVCAAADAMRVIPDAIRPAVRACFRRARLAQLTLEAIDEALNGPLDAPTKG